MALISLISPQIAKSAIVVVNRETGATERVITLQYNPESLSRTLQVQSAGDGADRLEANRLTGPPVESISIEAELDATDQLEFPDEDSSSTAIEVGVGAQLAALEMLLYPSSSSLTTTNSLASRGIIEILPATTPLTLFVYGVQRLVPVRITEFSIVEEAFDIALNPIQAKVSLGMRVLSVNDLPFTSIAGSLYMIHHQKKERLAQRATFGALTDTGLEGIL